MILRLNRKPTQDSRMRISKCTAALCVMVGAASNAALAQPIDSTNTMPLATPKAVDYVDNVIPASQLPPQEAPDTPDTYTGNPVNMRTSFEFLQPSKDEDAVYGISHNSALLTDNYGALMLNLQAVKQPLDSSLTLGKLTLSQSGLYLSNNLVLDSAIGDINSSIAATINKSGRFSVPIYHIRGAQAYLNYNNFINVNASSGNVGYFSGNQLTSFTDTNAHLHTLGIDFTPNDTWQSALQLAQLTPKPGAQTNSAITSLHLSNNINPLISEEIQLNLQLSDLQHSSLKNSSIWIDAQTKNNYSRHQYGAYTFDKQANWLGTPTNQGLQGLYYRHDWRKQRLSSASNIEVYKDRLNASSTNNGEIDNNFNAQTSLRYQHNHQTAVGGGLRYFKTNNQGLYGNTFVEKLVGWGRLRSDASWQQTQATDFTENVVQLGADQQIDLPLQQRLTVGLLYQTLSQSNTPSDSNTLQGRLNYYAPIGDNLSINSLLSLGQNKTSTTKNTNIDLSTGINWQLIPNWLLGLDYRYGKSQSAYNASPIVGLAAQTTYSQYNQHSVWLRLQHSFSRGSIAAAQAVTGPTGTLSGVVYEDSNQNGHQDTHEAGIADQTVLIDGRFTATTNTQGIWQLGNIPLGKHSVSCVSDNLPLPLRFNTPTQWAEVTVRSTTWVDCVATNPNEVN